MPPSLSRREILALTPSACGAVALLGLSSGKLAAQAADDTADAHADDSYPDDAFPRQDLAAVEEVVTYSHFHLPRVTELVSKRPALAKASWDWGFGDWETAIGAASHKGRHDIAELLMEHGARPTIFTFAMFGDLSAVRAMIEAHPGLQELHGPHGITLLAHARSGGKRAESVVRYLESLGDADLTGPDLQIPSDERLEILGEYSFGDRPSETLRIFEKSGEVRIQRADRVGRRLVRVAAHEYHPSGAPAVRVRFEVDGQVARRLNILDATLSLSAERVPSM